MNDWIHKNSENIIWTNQIAQAEQWEFKYPNIGLKIFFNIFALLSTTTQSVNSKLGKYIHHIQQALDHSKGITFILEMIHSNVSEHGSEFVSEQSQHL